MSEQTPSEDANWVVDVTLPDGFVHTTSAMTEWRARLGARRLAKVWRTGWPSDRIAIRRDTTTEPAPPPPEREPEHHEEMAE